MEHAQDPKRAPPTHGVEDATFAFTFDINEAPSLQSHVLLAQLYTRHLLAYLTKRVWGLMGVWGLISNDIFLNHSLQKIYTSTLFYLPLVDQPFDFTKVGN